MEQEPRYWFPAKQYGWGWGAPRVWQGWVVLATYLVLMFGAIPWLMKHRDPHPLAFVLYTMVLTVGLIVVCALKGEPPRWRWGK